MDSKVKVNAKKKMNELGERVDKGGNDDVRKKELNEEEHRSVVFFSLSLLVFSPFYLLSNNFFHSFIKFIFFHFTHLCNVVCLLCGYNYIQQNGTEVSP